MVSADLGADVVRVERPPGRGPWLGLDGAADIVRRGRRSFPAGLKEPAGCERVRNRARASADANLVTVAALERRFSAVPLDGLAPSRLSDQDSRGGAAGPRCRLGGPLRRGQGETAWTMSDASSA
ncbi:hypothetical protein [Streptomyces sp. NPDC005141]